MKQFSLADSPKAELMEDPDSPDQKKNTEEAASPNWKGVQTSEAASPDRPQGKKINFPKIESDSFHAETLPLTQHQGQGDEKDLIKQNLADQDLVGGKNAVPNSFLDLLGQRHTFDFKKIGNKSLAYDQLQLKKMRALYGRRATLNPVIKPKNDVVQEVKLEKHESEPESASKQPGDERELPADATIFHHYIIHPDTKWKSFFDVFILMLVGYSCITNLYVTAFTVEKTSSDEIIFWIVEVFFYFDFAFSWFMGFRDPETLDCVWSFKEIAMGYLQGWFFIDFVSIFPFQIFVPPGSGSATKLLRMPRMLRLGKLLDIKNVKRLMKAFQGETKSDQDIIDLFDNLFVYKLWRLLIVLTLLTYFQGCLWFLMSKSHEPTVEGQTTWYFEFGLDTYEEKSDQLVVSLYFALTMLSTVGYGDLFPMSNLERIIGVLCMMIGVATFSLVMGQFTQIHEEFQTQMADPDNYEQLQTWLLLSQRFRNKQPLPTSLYDAIDSDYCFFLQYDRNKYFNDPANSQVIDIPEQIKETISVDYLFADIIRKFARFFESTYFPGSTTPNKKLLTLLTKGLLPRRFQPTKEDKIIYEEFQEVDEMYFILEGFIGIGFSKPFCSITDEPYQMVRTQRGVQTICDHYVVNSRMSQWTYIALDECSAYALKKQFLHKVVFEKFPDFFPVVSSAAYSYYQKWIARTISKERQTMLEQLNRQRAMYYQVSLEGVKTARSPIPTMDEYRFWVREDSRQRRATREPADAVTDGQEAEADVEQKRKSEKEAQPVNAADEVDDEEVENNFFDTFEAMTDCTLHLNDGIRDFVKNNQSKFIQFFDGVKVSRS